MWWHILLSTTQWLKVTKKVSFFYFQIEANETHSDIFRYCDVTSNRCVVMSRIVAFSEAKNSLSLSIQGTFPIHKVFLPIVAVLQRISYICKTFYCIACKMPWLLDVIQSRKVSINILFGFMTNLKSPLCFLIWANSFAKNMYKRQSLESRTWINLDDSSRLSNNRT